MLTVLTGRSGSGKTAGLIKEITRVLSEGRRVFVLVPEQESVVMEKRLLDTLGNRCGLLAEVLNFERLPERVFRETGGNSERFVEKGGKVLLVTSVAENEGKSTLAANLALALAEEQNRVLLLDCDFRQPALHKIFEIPEKDGKDFGKVVLGKESASGVFEKHKDTNVYTGIWRHAGPIWTTLFWIRRRWE